MTEELYPCNCGTLRTKAEGGTTFTKCDECWDKYYPPKASPALSPTCAAAGIVWVRDVLKPLLEDLLLVVEDAAESIVEKYSIRLEGP